MEFPYVYSACMSVVIAWHDTSIIACRSGGSVSQAFLLT
jgi:hypothetical protein